MVTGVGEACSRRRGNDLDTKRVALGSTWRLTPAVCCRRRLPPGGYCGCAEKQDTNLDEGSLKPEGSGAQVLPLCVLLSCVLSWTVGGSSVEC